MEPHVISTIKVIFIFISSFLIHKEDTCGSSQGSSSAATAATLRCRRNVATAIAVAGTAELEPALAIFTKAGSSSCLSQILK